MYTKQEIILQSYRLGKSQRQISRDLNINRKTVKRYIEEYERLQQDDDSSYPPGLLSASLINNKRNPDIKTVFSFRNHNRFSAKKQILLV